MKLTQSDQTAIRSVIESQLLAFQQDNWEQAFAFASAGIQQQFDTLENFQRMVKISYHPVYRPRSVIFESVTWLDSAPAQRVLVMSAHRHLFCAVYKMEQQLDQTWRIAGCHLEPIRS